MIDYDSLADAELTALSAKDREHAKRLLDVSAAWSVASIVRDARIRAARRQRDNFIDPLTLPVSARKARRAGRAKYSRMLAKRGGAA